MTNIAMGNPLKMEVLIGKPSINDIQRVVLQKSEKCGILGQPWLDTLVPTIWL